MKQLFSLIGPTGVGKTSFALKLAQQILAQKKYTGIDLISADSRQVYQGLEIISGADIPPGFTKNKIQDLTSHFFTKNKINLHGVSTISPDQEWSVTHFQDFAWEVIRLAKAKNRLVILIGGTGLYHDQLQNFMPSLRVKPNAAIRQKAESMELEALKIWAKQINPARFSQMNHSDQHNPRRLIRVIEIGAATQLAPHQSRHSAQIKLPWQNKATAWFGELMPISAPAIKQIYIGLNQNLGIIEQKIAQRVKKRFAHGAIDEVQKLQKKYRTWSLPALSALGVNEVSQYINGFLSQEECQELWTLHELQYAKRQLTWWKNKAVTWFNLDNSKWQEAAFTYILQLC